MEEVFAHILDLMYKIEDNRAVIYLFCITPEGKRIAIKDNSLKPYFWVLGDIPEIKLKQLKNEQGYVTNVEIKKKNMHGKEIELYQVFADLPKSVFGLASQAKLLPNVKGIFENDLLFTRRYLLDKGLIPQTKIKANGEWTKSEFNVDVFNANEIEKISDETYGIPRILGFDIETYGEGEINPEKNPILMLAAVGDNFNKIVTWKNFDTKNKDIEFVPDERALLERFKSLLEEYKPHIITGYNSDNFDFPYIKKRADKYGVVLNLGLDNSQLQVPERDDAARINGIPHIDIYKFVRKIYGRSMKTDVFTLNAVSEELLNEKKHDVNIANITKIWDNEPNKLDEYARYNLQDSLLTYKLCRLLWSDIEEFTTLIGLPVETTTRLSYSQLVEQYIFKQAQNYNEVAPNKPNDNEMELRSRRSITGAFVFEPTPGLYHKIVVLDFRSLYPSIIISHNISISSLRCNCCLDSKNNITVDGTKYWFCEKKQGFLSQILKEVVIKRTTVKKLIKNSTGHEKQMLRAKSEALKLLSNSFYGYLGFSIARWYSIECAETITAFARQYIQSVIKKAQEKGFSVLYSDTDSIFLQLGDKTSEDAKNFQKDINEHLPGMMELEWENYYPTGIFVALKGAGGGAKKRYALCDENGKLKIRGFETVRRNVAPIAKEVQENVLKILLKEDDAKKALNYIKDTIKEVAAKKIDKGKMIIFTQLQKKIEQYESYSPHVAAAARMKARGINVGRGTFIKYIIGSGAGKLRDKVKLPDEIQGNDYDSDYYIEHQIIPAVEKMMEVFGYKAQDLQKDDKQSSLAGFW